MGLISGDLDYGGLATVLILATLVLDLGSIIHERTSADKVTVS
jgi:hypothetical protein